MSTSFQEISEVESVYPSINNLLNLSSLRDTCTKVILRSAIMWHCGQFFFHPKLKSNFAPSEIKFSNIY